MKFMKMVNPGDGQILAVCAAPGFPEGNVQEFQVLPFGRVKSEKGDFLVDEDSIREIIQSFNAAGNDTVIDYEHQTLTGEQAPAAGWIKSLEDRGEQGLWAKVEWTPRAAEYLANKEYRYFSPVVLIRKSDRRAVKIHSVGLTNTPAIHGLEALVNKNIPGDHPGKEDDEMKAKICKMLGLPEDATEEKVLESLEKMRQAGQAPVHGDILSLLDLKSDASLDDVKAAVLALKNPSGYISVQEFNQLKQKLELRERDDLVAEALKAGKVAPAQKEWAEQYALKDPAGFRAFLEKAPVVVPVGQEIAGGRVPPAGGSVTDQVQLSVNKMLGISEEDFKKYGGDN